MGARKPHENASQGLIANILKKIDGLDESGRGDANILMKEKELGVWEIGNR